MMDVCGGGGIRNGLDPQNWPIQSSWSMHTEMVFVCPPSTWSALRVITHARCLLSLSTTATTIVVLTNLTVVNLHYALAGFVHF